MLPGRRISPSCCCCYYRDRREWSRWTTRDDGYCRHRSESVPSSRSCWDHVSVFATTTPKDGVVQSESPGRELTSCATPNTIVFINLHGRGGHHSLLALSIVIGSRSQIGDLGLVIVLLSMDVEWISNRSVILKTADRVTITWIERIINRKLSQPIVSVYPNISTSDRPPQF